MQIIFKDFYIFQYNNVINNIDDIKIFASYRSREILRILEKEDPCFKKVSIKKGVLQNNTYKEDSIGFFVNEQSKPIIMFLTASQLETVHKYSTLAKKTNRAYNKVIAEMLRTKLGIPYIKAENIDFSFREIFDLLHEYGHYHHVYLSNEVNTFEKFNGLSTELDSINEKILKKTKRLKLKYISLKHEEMFLEKYIKTIIKTSHYELQAYEFAINFIRTHRKLFERLFPKIFLNNSRTNFMMPSGTN